MQDAELAIAEDRVNREAHEEHVDRAGPSKEHSFTGRQSGAELQAEEAMPRVGDDGAARAENRPVFSFYDSSLHRKRKISRSGRSYAVMASLRSSVDRFRRPLGDGVLIVLLLGFALGNLEAWRHTGRPTGLGATGFEVMTAAFCVGRSKPLVVTGDWRAWPAALCGAFLMLLARPVTGDSRPAWEAIQMLGLLVAAFSLGVLRHSFGLVAANRGIKTSGLYRVVRHPAYLGYFVTWFAYVGENPTLRNVVLLAVASVFQLLRIRQEEAVLSLDPGYRSYRARVRHRLVPFVY